jgi:hypothetical protein
MILSPKLSSAELCTLVKAWGECEHNGRSMRYETLVQAPSGSLISIHFRSEGAGWVVSDGGSAFNEAISSGITRPNFNLNVRRLLRARGLSISDGEIESPSVDVSRLHQAAVAVVNTSKDVAEILVHMRESDGEFTLDDRARQLLVRKYKSLVSPRPIYVRGESEKSHKFDVALILPDDRKVLIDTVSHHTNAINSVVVANIDIKNLGDKNILQRIVFDPSEPWKLEELSLLKVGAQPLALTNLADSIDRLAA